MGTRVETASGHIEGIGEASVLAFKGVPFAVAERFGPPRPVAPWTGTRAATAFGPTAPQIPYPFLDPGNPDDPAWAAARDFHRGAILDYRPTSEDCQTLNVWTPSLQGRRPVMVWCHGGAFTHGSGAWAWWTGENLSRGQDVVVVTLSHRINIFGFLDLTTVAGSSESFVANAGMRDIVAALEWVRDNIAAFGGDAGNVTIFGQSGGGAKVGTLMAMPSASGLFHKAIVQSGAQYVRAVTRERAQRTAERVLAHLEIMPDRLDAIRNVDVPALIAAYAASDESGIPGAPRTYGPVIDPATLPAHPCDPASPAQSHDIPLLIGATTDEITSLLGFRLPKIFALAADEVEPLVASFGALDAAAARRLVETYRASRRGASPSEIFSGVMSDRRFGFPVILEAERKAAGSAAPVHLYRLSWRSPVAGGRYGAPHNLCLPLIFTRDGAPGITGDGMTGHHRLAARMQAAWGAFARSGSPAHGDLPAWPRYDATTRATMIFDTECRIENDPRADERRAQAALPVLV